MISQMIFLFIYLFVLFSNYSFWMHSFQEVLSVGAPVGSLGTDEQLYLYETMGILIGSGLVLYDKTIQILEVSSPL